MPQNVTSRPPPALGRKRNAGVPPAGCHAPWSPAGHVRPARAYSLAELLIVVLIIGMIGMVAIPQTTGMHSPRLKTAANVLAADLEFCQSQCINDPGHPYVVSFDSTNNAYAITTPPLAPAPCATPVNHPADSMPFRNDFATGRNAALTGVTLTSVTNIPNGPGNPGTALPTLAFNSFGVPSTTLPQNLTITLTADNTQMLITVDYSTGDVSISPATPVAP